MARNREEQETRELLRSCLDYLKKTKDRGGLCVVGEQVIGDVVLRVGDRMVPSPELRNTANYKKAELPFRAVFWRANKMRSGAVTDPVHRRNPIFNTECGTSPAGTMVVDALHTVYYGPMTKFESAVLWRVVLQNPWGFRGNNKEVMEQCGTALETNLFNWFHQKNIPHDRRITDFGLSFLGDRLGCAVDGELQHPGDALKLKAAEVGTLLPWVESVLHEHGTRLPDFEHLSNAGKSLASWLQITRENGLVLPALASQGLRDAAVRHLLSCARANIAMVPKHHFFAELSKQAGSRGNPKALATWADEGLNLRLRAAAQHAHHARQEERIFTWFNLQGALLKDKSNYGIAKIPGLS